MTGRSNALTDGQPRGRSIHRRTFIYRTVAGGIAGLAGCTGDPSDPEDTTDNSDSPGTEESTDTASETQNGEEESSPDSTETPSETGGDDTETTEYEPREGCTVVTSTDIGLDETVTVYPINGDPEIEGIRFTYQGIDVERDGEIRIEYLNGFTADLYIEEGERMDIDSVTGIELTELGEDQIQVQFLRIPEEYDSRSEWEPAEVERC